MISCNVRYKLYYALYYLLTLEYNEKNIHTHNKQKIYMNKRTSLLQVTPN